MSSFFTPRLQRTVGTRTGSLATRTPRAPVLNRDLGRALYSSQGYGDGKGDPAAENPTEQGVSSRSRELEHPGPEQHVKKPSSSSSKQNENHSDRRDGSEASDNAQLSTRELKACVF
ncbi:hypothetical protein PDE_07291 [Penicillium oxalicum 114-2]|uniref:Uncharacterized protein n=1 Tax=Penicillium oxalicum (strain 114-2 / CGMCC 5302) TaxID=933388 RepID=S7ZUC7_PENO1|nr:hypothetical protein PDE_07291 [Penicillium oxalicum 114-2]